MFKNLINIVVLLISVVILSGFSEKLIQGNFPYSVTGYKNYQINQTGQKYGVKSGIVVYKSTIMNMEQSITLYFDNYGAKEATESVMSMMGMKINQRTFIKNGYAYSVDLTKKTATKTKITEPDITKINYNDLSEEMVKKMNLKKLGKATILNKECEKMSIDWTETSMKGIVYVWKGIALKSEITVMDMKMLMEATSIKTDVPIPADKFLVPAGYTITEL